MHPEIKVSGSMSDFDHKTFPDVPLLDANEAQVFTQLIPRRSMPTFEISGITGLYGPVLINTLDELKKKKLITVSPSGSATTNIVTVDKKYF